MTNAKRDANNIPSILATLNTDGVTPVPLQVSATNKLKVSNGTTGTGQPYGNAQKDENRVSTIWGVSSADGVTIIPIYCNSSGALLTKST